jgi:hypothetical protein
MSTIDNGVRYKGTFTVRKSRLHSSGNFFEHQLVDSGGTLFNKGVWVQERALKLEKRGRSPAPGRSFASGYDDVPDQTDMGHFGPIHAKPSTRGRAAKSSSYLSIPESVYDKTATHPDLISDLDDHKDSFISRLVDDLFETTTAVTKADVKNGISPAKCGEILSRALPAFARKIGHADQTQISRDVMVFVLKHKK